MDPLPPELLELVCNFLPKEAALDFRLVSHAFARAATPRAFREINLYMFSFSICRLWDLAHSRKARYVKIVNVYTDQLVKLFGDDGIFPPGGSYATMDGPSSWSLYVGWPTERGGPSISDFEIRRSYYNEQVNMLGKMIQPFLIKIFGALPALTTVRIESLSRFGEHSELERRQQWQEHPRSAATLRSICLCFPLVLKTRRTTDSHVTVFVLSALGERSLNPVNAVVRTLTLPEQGVYRLLPEWMSKFPPERMPKLDEINHCLRSAHSLVLSRHRGQGFSELDASCDNTPAALSLTQHCNDLRHLSLTLDCPTPLPWMLLEPVTNNAALSIHLRENPSVWPMLQSLNITFAWLLLEDLLPFLRAHAHCLTYFGLEYCSVDDVDGLLRSIREILVKLNDIHLFKIIPSRVNLPFEFRRRCFYDGLEAGSIVRDWLLGAGDDDPLPYDLPVQYLPHQLLPDPGVG